MSTPSDPPREAVEALEAALWGLDEPWCERSARTALAAALPILYAEWGDDLLTAVNRKFEAIDDPDCLAVQSGRSLELYESRATGASMMRYFIEQFVRRGEAT
jgi:hypothetical protein